MYWPSSKCFKFHLFKSLVIEKFYQASGGTWIFAMASNSCRAVAQFPASLAQRKALLQRITSWVKIRVADRTKTSNHMKSREKPSKFSQLLEFHHFLEAFPLCLTPTAAEHLVGSSSHPFGQRVSVPLLDAPPSHRLSWRCCSWWRWASPYWTANLRF